MSDPIPVEEYFHIPTESLDGPVSPAPAKPDLNALPEEAADAAYREAAYDSVFFWQGQRLQPFSVERYCTFVSQRISMGAPGLFAALADGTAFFPDALRIIWLCSQESHTIEELRMEPRRMQQAIDLWAQQNAPLSSSGLLIKTAVRIFNHAHATEPQTRPTDRSSHADNGRGN